MYQFVDIELAIIAFFQSGFVRIIGFITGLISVIAAINYFLMTVKKLKEVYLKMLKLIGDIIGRKINPPSISLILKTFFLFFCIFLSILVGKSFTKNLPVNAVLTKAAWDAFNAKNYQKAIEIADEVIDQFGPTAERMQRESRSEPPEGRVSETEERRIHEQGPLNDVATVWFIKGRSLEKLGKKQEAIAAYREAEKFPHARTWDLAGFFWKPATAAQDRRIRLESR